MDVGKVSETVLKRSVFKQLKVKRDEVLYGPAVGEDCSVLRFAADELVVLSTDPITGATQDIGSLAVHITANDIASSGAEVVGVMVSLLLPEGTSEDELKIIMGDISQTCHELNIQVLGGHTEVTRAVTQPIVTLTGVGKVKEHQLTQTSQAKPGQAIVMTKWAGLEGTAIIAKEKEVELKAHFNHELIERGKKLAQYLSVVRESAAAIKHGVKAMHDITEGGVYGALWELATCSKVGIDVYLDAIPILQETIEICEYYDLNPYQLMSSGSMLMTTEDGEGLVKALATAGISAAVIGQITSSKQKNIHAYDTIKSLYPPQADELYKVL